MSEVVVDRVEDSTVAEVAALCGFDRSFSSEKQFEAWAYLNREAVLQVIGLKGSGTIRRNKAIPLFLDTACRPDWYIETESEAFVLEFKHVPPLKKASASAQAFGLGQTMMYQTLYCGTKPLKVYLIANAILRSTVEIAANYSLSVGLIEATPEKIMVIHSLKQQAKNNALQKRSVR